MKRKDNKMQVLIFIILALAVIAVVVAGILMCESPFIVMQTILYLCTVFAAVWAILVSKRTADAQNDLMKQEWLPYLSYEKMHVTIVNTAKSICPEFHMVLRNDGRCVVQYKITTFDVTLITHYSDLVLPENDESENIQRFRIARKQLSITPKSIRKTLPNDRDIGINSKFAENCGKYQFLYEKEGIFQFQIDFVVEYRRKQEGEDEYPYSLKYVVDMVYDNGRFIESISKTDIEGY